MSVKVLNSYIIMLLCLQYHWKQSSDTCIDYVVYNIIYIYFLKEL